jgi:hypothetical protein
MLTILSKITGLVQFLPVVKPIIKKLTGRKIKFPLNINSLAKSSDADIVMSILRFATTLKEGDKMDFSKIFPILQLVYARILRAEFIKLIDNPDSSIDDLIVKAFDAIFDYQGG